MRSRFSLFAVFLLLFATTTAAETFVVNKEADDNGPCTPDDCSFREALLAAGTNPDHDTVIVSAGTYRVEIPGLSATTGSFDIRSSAVDVLGEPGTRIVGNGEDRVFDINSSQVLLSRLDISGGDTGGAGGGVEAFDSEVTIIDSSIHHNRADASGGGVADLQGQMRLERCVVYANEANAEGGGVYAIGFPVSPVSLTILNSTISGNHSLQGGGVGVEFEVDVTIRNTTIAENTVDFRASAFYTDGSPPARLTNTIFAGTCSQNLPPSSSGNLEGPDETCLLWDSTDRMDVADPGLGPLGDHGGPTWTHALLAGSPAIDTAVGSCEPTDQRGIERPVDGDGDGVATCDVGAFEFLPAPSVVEVPSASRIGRMTLAALLAGLGIVALGRRG